jgi:hypothetical protein
MYGFLILAALCVMVIIFEIKTLNMLYNETKRRALTTKFEDIVKHFKGQ